MFIFLLAISVFCFATTGIVAAALGIRRYEILVAVGFPVAFAALYAVLTITSVEHMSAATVLWSSFGIAMGTAVLGVAPLVAESWATGERRSRVSKGARRAAFAP